MKLFFRVLPISKDGQYDADKLKHYVEEIRKLYKLICD